MGEQVELFDFPSRGKNGPQFGDRVCIDFQAVSGELLAKALGVDRSTVWRWSKAGMPSNENGTYSLADCFAWCVERSKGSHGLGKTDEAQKWLTMFRRERAQMSKLERLRLEGSLILKSDVEAAFASRAGEFQRSILLQARRLAHRIAAKTGSKVADIQALLQEDAEELLKSYTRRLQVGDDD